MRHPGSDRFASLAQVRAGYAAELRVAGPVESEAVVRAFASEPADAGHRA
ncbi:MAG: hypothetical protein ABSC95_17960 [Acetobacteraceae bacterium]